MTDRKPSGRFLVWDHLEARQVPAVVGLAPAAVALYSSPLVAAASTAATAYQVGQLAYSGHTTFLLGAVRVDQPFALQGRLGKHPGPQHPSAQPPKPAPLGIRLQVPPLLVKLLQSNERPAPHAARGRGR